MRGAAMEVTYIFTGGPLDGLEIPMADRRIGVVIGGWLWAPPLLSEVGNEFTIVPMQVNFQTGQVVAIGPAVHQYAVRSSIVEADQVVVRAIHVEAFSSANWALTPSGQ